MRLKVPQAALRKMIAGLVGIVNSSLRSSIFSPVHHLLSHAGEAGCAA